MNLPSEQASSGAIYGMQGLITDLWRTRWIIAAVVGLAVVSGILAGLLLPKEYTADVVFQPVLAETNSGGIGSNIASFGGALGGLASLAGISSPGKSKDQEAVAVLQSQLLTRMFIQQNKLMPLLFANRWDPSHQRWKQVGAKRPPDLWTANQLFKKKIRKVVENHATGLYVLSIRWKNPQVAADWANRLVELTNTYLRNVAVNRTERNVRYLTSQASVTHDVEVKRAIYALLEEQIDREMIARGRHEYALKIIDPAFAPRKPSSLGPVKLGIVALILGLLVCVLTTYFVGALRNSLAVESASG